MNHSILIGWLALVMQSVLAAKPEISTSLGPQEIALGEATQSRGVFSSALGSKGILPEAEGLKVVPTKRTSQYVSANGEIRDSQSLSYPVTATRAETDRTLALKVGDGPEAVGSSPVALVVAGSGLPPAPDQTRQVGKATKKHQEELAPNRVEPGRFVSTLRPLFLLPWFLIVNLVALAGIAAAALSVRRRVRLVRSPHLLRASLAGRALRAHMAAMAVAIRNAEAGDFFVAACSALQHGLAKHWGLPADTITLAEIKARTNGDAGDLRRVFEMADRVARTGQHLPPDDLLYWQIIVKRELERLQ